MLWGGGIKYSQEAASKETVEWSGRPLVPVAERAKAWTSATAIHPVQEPPLIEDCSLPHQWMGGLACIEVSLLNSPRFGGTCWSPAQRPSNSRANKPGGGILDLMQTRNRITAQRVWAYGTTSPKTKHLHKYEAENVPASWLSLATDWFLLIFEGLFQRPKHNYGNV